VVARVAALVGRPLVDADEQAGAPPVVVLGYDIWQSRFGASPAIIGQSVRLGTTSATVVGVMPKDFRFPVSHDAWIPFRLNLSEFKGRQGPEINVFGRLAAGSGIDEAQAELSTIGLRLAAEFPDTHTHLRPEVLPYVQSVMDIRGLGAAALLSINVFMLLLLVLVCGNVALLMFARAAARESEIVVRTALGAGRGRIIGQLFAEALVLAGVAAPVGLAAAGFLLRWWLTVAEINSGGRLPFWFSDSLAPSTVAYAVVLTLVAAIVSGVVPALKVTGRVVEARLRQMAPGAGGLRFGGVWTVVIIAQVAVTLAFPASVFLVRRAVVQVQTLAAGFAAAEYLSARLETDGEERLGLTEGARSESVTRAQLTYEEIERRLRGESAVAGITFTCRLPRTVHPQRWLEIDGAESDIPAANRRRRINTVSVAVNYFDALDVRMVSGRAFRPGDLRADPGPVIVNQSFVQRVLQGRNAVGRRVRYLEDGWQEAGAAAEMQEPWHEIIGIVPDLGTIHDDPHDLSALYHPVAPGATLPTHIAVHVRGEPGAFASRLRTIAAEVDPTLRLYDVTPLNRVGGGMWNEFDFLWRLLTMMSSLAVLLSLSGIYAAVSFAVSRRRREIGIRVALGARPRGIVTPILRQPFLQVGIGVVAGTCLVLALVEAASSSGLSLRGAALVACYAALMMGVCLLACIVPIMRALRIEPTEALRVDG
jgi:predicted permease